jgi:chromate reductase
MTILAIAGSLRKESHNRRLLLEAQRLAPQGVDVALWNRLGEIPPYDPGADVEPAPGAVADLRRAIAAADGVLFATPEYNASIPGVLKNAVDWASRPWPDNALRGKPVAVVGATEGSFGAVWAQADLRRVLGITGARVLEEGVALPYAHQAFDEEGRLLEPVYRDGVVAVLRALSAEAAESSASRRAA